MSLILIVDDDPALLKLLRLRLRKEGHSVIACETGKAALTILDNEVPDLVMTDLRMAGMDGLELFGEIHQRFPLLPVILMTAHGTIQHAVQALQKGLFSYIAKPFEASYLMSEIDRALTASNALGAVVPVATRFGSGSRREVFLTRHPAMQQTLQQARQCAASRASVLVVGPNGCGKELLVRSIHAAGPDAAGPLEVADCRIPGDAERCLRTLEDWAGGGRRRSMLSFVDRRQPAAPNLLFAHVSHLDGEVQQRLAQAMAQCREVEQARRGMPRVFCTSARDLRTLVGEGDFRPGLAQALAATELVIPPLSERPQDIPLLAHHFLVGFAQFHQKGVRGFAPGVLEIFSECDWPGDVRQLRAAVEGCVLLTAHPLVDEVLARRILPQARQQPSPRQQEARPHERMYLSSLLQVTNGDVSLAAQLAQQPEEAFDEMLSRYDLHPAEFR